MLFLSQSIICQVVYTLNTEEIIQKPYKTEIDYVVIKVPGYQMTTELGDPQLPVEYLRFAIPRGMKAEILGYKVLMRETKPLEKKILPAQHPIPTALNYQRKGFVEPNSAIYESESIFPGKIAEIVHEGLFDGNIPIITIAVYPVQYYPIKNEVELLSSIEITLKYIESENWGILRTKTKRSYNEHIKLLKATIDNEDDVFGFGLDDQIIEDRDYGGLKSISADFEYIVITSEELSSSFTEFTNWKRRKGVDIGLVTVEDISSEYSGDLVSGIYDEAGKIREFLNDMYSDYGLEYVLLGGDNTVVPVRYGFGDINDQNPERNNYLHYIPADLYYADFTGDWKVDADTLYGEPFNPIDPLDDDDPDYETEVYVGRILCSSSEEVSNWTTKLKKYEIYPGNGNGSYLTKSFMIQSDDMQDAEQAQYVANHLGDFNETIWEEIPSYNSLGIPTFPTGVDAVDEMNENYGLISWFSHAGPSSIGIGTLGNNDGSCQDCKYNICALDSWDETGQSSSCIEEDGNGLDNLTNYNFPGIVYTIACTTTPFDNDLVSPNTSVNLGQGWTTNTLAGGPAFLGFTRVGWVGDSYLLYEEFADIIDNNTTFHLGKAEALSKSNYSDHYYSYSHNLLGCPETEIWTESPNTYNNVTITENGSNVTVSTGVSGSNICLMSIVDNGDTYHELQPDVSSHTFTNVPFQYYVTVTKHNYYPYLKDPAIVYVQNVSIYDSRIISGEKIYAGSNVTQEISSGPVIINSGANVIFNAEDELLIEETFDVKSGGSFEVNLN